MDPFTVIIAGLAVGNLCAAVVGHRRRKYNADLPERDDFAILNALIAKLETMPKLPAYSVAAAPFTKPDHFTGRNSSNTKIGPNGSNSGYGW